MPTQIAVANTRARVRAKNLHVYEELDKAFSYFFKAAPYQRAFQVYQRDKERARKEGRKARGWNGIVHLFDAKDNSFPAGLLPRAQKLLRRHEIEIYDRRVPPALHPKLMQGRIREELVDKREWQNDAFEMAKASPRGVFEAATGAGKTTLIARLVAWLGRPTLILVHRTTLAKSTLDRFREIIEFPNADGDVFGLIGGGVWEPGLVTVATYQTLSEMLTADEKGTHEWLGQFHVVHIDESHHVAARTLYALTNAMEACYFRYGYSATPFKNNKETELHLVGVCGEIIFSYKAAQAIKDEIILPPHIYMVDGEFDPLENIDKQDGSYLGKFNEEYKEGIVMHRPRNHLLANLANACAEHSLPTLVLFRQKLQGDSLMRLIDDSEVVDGNSSLAARVDAKERLASGDIPVLIASTIFNEGEDVPAIGAIVIGGGYRAEHLALQQVGRGLRPYKNLKFVLVFDIFDGHSPRLEKHSLARAAAWRDAGFDVHRVTIEELATLMDGEGFWNAL